MNIARILFPIKVLGPGNRVGIWTCGCNHRCEGCSNPELWTVQSRFEISVENVIRLLDSQLHNKRVDGFVITGGDPFLQTSELYQLLLNLKRYSDDLLVYTGYTFEELLASDDKFASACLNEISVLIDGKYIQALNDGSFLRGSSNQRIIYLDESKRRKYEEYYSRQGENRIQNFITSDGVISVGIHKLGFQEDLPDMAARKGVIIRGE